MAHNQEMLDHNPNWAGKVRIIGVSLDKGREEVKQRITEKKWTSVEHYFAPGGWHAKGPTLYGVKWIPFVLLFDGNGKIVKIGHDLENTINGLINGTYKPGEKTETKEDGEPEKPSNVTMADLIVELQKVWANNKDTVEKYKFKIRGVFTDNRLNKVTSCTLSLLSNEAFDNADKEEVQKSVDVIKNSLPKECPIPESMIRFVEYGTIAKKDVCVECKKSLKEQDQFVQREDGEVALCYECVSKPAYTKECITYYYVKKNA